MIIDHIGITISNHDQSKAFYQQVLSTLKIDLVMEYQAWMGFGRDNKPEFWVQSGDVPTTPIHMAFSANDRREVDAFYEAALALGAKDNGKPGIREIYHPNYYGAFVIDINGHNLEAVCHLPE